MSDKNDSVAQKSDPATTPVAEGIRPVHGTLYEIDHDAINIAKKGEQGQNLRYLSGDDNSLGVGFEKAEMDRLHHSIRDSGLHNPLICRWVTRDGVLTVQLVDGERRHRTLDRLLAKNEKCYDPASRKMIPAKELYSRVLCRVYDAPTDKDAMRLSYQENRSRVAFTDKVDISLVADLRDKGFKDDEILDITGQKAEWLRDTDKLIAALKDDPETLSALACGTIRRDAALVFIGIEDKKERAAAVKAATEIAQAKHKKKIEKIDGSIRRAKATREEAEADKEDAKFSGDANAAAKAEEKAKKASKTIEERTAEKATSKPEVGGRQARSTARKTGSARPNDGSKPRAMSNKKAMSDVITPLEVLIKAGGKEEGSDEVICHPDVLKCMRDAAKLIATNDEGQIKRLIKKWGKHFAESGYAPKKPEGK